MAKEDAPNMAPSKKGSQSSPVAVSGSVEDKAKQVIRGNFGNGSDRKQALGAEYELIKAVKDWSNIRVAIIEWHFNSMRSLTKDKNYRVTLFQEIIAILKNNAKSFPANLESLLS